MGDFPISLVMTTYNGSKHIRKQLESLLLQTKQPNEVLIFDDQSTDDTVEIISEYIHANCLFNWTVVKNQNRVGWKKNFIEGIKKASGDYIFLSDQDDIWYPEKIEKMYDAIQMQKVCIISAHKSALSCIQFNYSGKLIATASDKVKIK